MPPHCRSCCQFEYCDRGDHADFEALTPAEQDICAVALFQCMDCLTFIVPNSWQSCHCNNATMGNASGHVAAPTLEGYPEAEPQDDSAASASLVRGPDSNLQNSAAPSGRSEVGASVFSTSLALVSAAWLAVALVR